MKRIFIIFSLFIIVINSFGQEGQYDYLKVKKELKYKGVAFENWINDSTPGSVITGANGLSKDGNNIELGGSELNKNVIIEGAGYGISFGTSINKAGNIYNYVNGDYAIISDGDVIISSNGQEWTFNGTWFYNEVTGDSLITFDEVRSLISSSALKIPTNFKYNFDATITDSRPGPGYFRFNNATYSLADEIYVDYYDDDNVDKSDFLTLADTGAHISVVTGANSYANYIISGGVINSSSYVKFEVTYLNNSGVISGLSTISLDLGGTGGGSGTTDSLYHADTQVWLQSGDTIPKADSVRVTYTADTIKTPLITTTGSLTLTNSTNSVSFTNDTIFAEEEAIKTKYVEAEKVNSDTVETTLIINNDAGYIEIISDNIEIKSLFGSERSEIILIPQTIELGCYDNSYNTKYNLESYYANVLHYIDANNSSNIRVGNGVDQEINLSVENSAVSNSLLIEDNYFSFLYSGSEYARFNPSLITLEPDELQLNSGILSGSIENDIILRTFNDEIDLISGSTNTNTITIGNLNTIFKYNGVEYARIDTNTITTKILEVADSIRMPDGTYIKATSATQTPVLDSLYVDVIGGSTNPDSVTVYKNIYVPGRVFVNSYQAFAYEDPDSVIVTSLSTSWAFLGGGDNNKFTNTLSDGFSFDGDTLQFNQDVDDTRDSVLFTINYGGQSATTTVNKTVYNGIFIKGALESAYAEYRPCTKTARTTTAEVYYTGPFCTPTPIWLKDGDKIQIRARCAATTTTLWTTNFSVYLCERK